MKRPVLFTGDIFRLQRRGGISRYFVELARRLERPHRVIAGFHRSEVLDAVNGGDPSARRVEEFPGAARLWALANRRIDARALRGAPEAIVHPTYYRDPATLPARATVVVTVFDMAHERQPEHFRRPWWSAADPAGYKRALCERATAIVCISKATRLDLIECHPELEARARVIHLAASAWREPADAIAEARMPFFLWVGERAGYKNFLATLEAWANCRAADDSSLLLMGGGPLAPDERAAAVRLGVDARVRHASGSDGRLRWAYENATGLLYTSRWEGFGLPVLEALSLGCPVVASDRPVFHEVAGDQAILVEPTDRDSMADGIARCVAAGRSADRVADRVAQAARFSWEACSREHEIVYGSLDP